MSIEKDISTLSIVNSVEHFDLSAFSQAQTIIYMNTIKLVFAYVYCMRSMKLRGIWQKILMVSHSAWFIVRYLTGHTRAAETGLLVECR